MLRLNLETVASTVVPIAALHACRRHQSTDQFHRFLHNPHVVQPDGVDGLPQTKAAQQMWLNTEQWEGYSDTYLQRFMQYPTGVEHPNPRITPRNPLLEACLSKVFAMYGPLAERLIVLHKDVLHPRFHEAIAEIKAEREKMAEAIDEVYADLHPTAKTLWDAYMVRRYFHLGDWIRHVEGKRHNLFDRMSPEHIDFMIKTKGIAEHHIERLNKLKQMLVEDPAVGLLQDDRAYTDDELVMIRQKSSYYRTMRRYGRNYSAGDMMPK